MADLTRRDVIMILGTRNGTLAGVDLSGLDLSKLDFSRQDVQRANFRGCDLRDADFHEGHASEADFTGADLRNASFNTAIAHKAKFDRADMREFDGTELDAESASFEAADMTGGWLQGAHLLESSFARARLVDMHFDCGANVSKVVWTGAHIEGGNWSEMENVGEDAPFAIDADGVPRPRAVTPVGLIPQP